MIKLVSAKTIQAEYVKDLCKANKEYLHMYEVHRAIGLIENVTLKDINKIAKYKIQLECDICRKSVNKLVEIYGKSNGKCGKTAGADICRNCLQDAVWSIDG